MNLENVVALFDGVKKTGKGYLVKCPLHKDDTASLHIGEDGNRLLIKCFAGCDTTALLAFINGKDVNNFKRLSEDSLREVLGHTVERPKLEFDSAYRYTDANGTTLYEVQKFYEVYSDGRRKKTFKYRRPATPQEQEDYGVEVIYSIEGCERVPYNLPDLLAADPDEYIYLVDGEKDCDTLTRHGFIATCFPFGSGKNKWNKDYSRYFVGRKVVLIPDNDKPGYDFCLDAAKSLKQVVSELVFVILPVKELKEDVSDFFNRYMATRGHFQKLVEESISIHQVDDAELENLFRFQGPSLANIEQSEPVQNVPPFSVNDLDPFKEFQAELDKGPFDLFLGLCDTCKGTGFALVETDKIETVLPNGLVGQDYSLERCPICYRPSFGHYQDSAADVNY